MKALCALCGSPQRTLRFKISPERADLTAQVIQRTNQCDKEEMPKIAHLIGRPQLLASVRICL
jgi:hypothetical protein